MIGHPEWLGEEEITEAVKQNRLKCVEFLLKHPCVDCGENDIIVLEFDHILPKVKTVTKRVSAGQRWAKVQEEIDRCQVRCCNCHRRRHAYIDGTWRTKAYREIITNRNNTLIGRIINTLKIQWEIIIWYI